MLFCHERKKELTLKSTVSFRTYFRELYSCRLFFVLYAIGQEVHMKNMVLGYMAFLS